VASIWTEYLEILDKRASQEDMRQNNSVELYFQNSLFYTNVLFRIKFVCLFTVACNCVGNNTKQEK
jgi:hypothetical protein